MNEARYWAVLILGHGIVIMASPPLAGLLFTAFGGGLPVSLDFATAFVVANILFFSLLFYGPLSLILTLLGSPILWQLAKLKSLVVAFGCATCFGATVGFVLGAVNVGGEEAAMHGPIYTAAIITSIFAASLLELTWRVAILLRRSKDVSMSSNSLW